MPLVTAGELQAKTTTRTMAAARTTTRRATKDNSNHENPNLDNSNTPTMRTPPPCVNDDDDDANLTLSLSARPSAQVSHRRWVSPGRTWKGLVLDRESAFSLLS